MTWRLAPKFLASRACTVRSLSARSLSVVSRVKTAEVIDIDVNTSLLKPATPKYIAYERAVLYVCKQGLFARMSGKGTVSNEDGLILPLPSFANLPCLSP